MPAAGGLQQLTTPVYGIAMHDGGGHDHTGGGGHHRRPEAPAAAESGRRVNANYRYFGTILFLGALAMILLMVMLNR
jgi:hypothetical protein